MAQTVDYLMPEYLSVASPIFHRSSWRSQLAARVTRRCVFIATVHPISFSTHSPLLCEYNLYNTVIFVGFTWMLFDQVSPSLYYRSCILCVSTSHFLVLIKRTAIPTRCKYIRAAELFESSPHPSICLTAALHRPLHRPRQIRPWFCR